jgi:hypothetical protein
MDNGHLSDEQIQEILDARALAQAVFPPWHLKTCRSCQERYRSFQRLYEGLAVDPGFTLPPHFSDSVLDRVPAPRPAFLKSRFFPVALACGAGALLLTGLAIFVNLKPLADGSLRIVDSLLRAFRPLAGPFRELFSWFSGSAKLFIYGGLGLLSASLVDHFLRRQLWHRPR